MAREARWKGEEKMQWATVAGRGRGREGLRTLDGRAQGQDTGEDKVLGSEHLSSSPKTSPDSKGPG